MSARVLALAAVLSLPACSPRKPLPVLGTVPDFTLTDRHGIEFHGSSLRGHVWIADFIYTNCPGPCPMMTRRMHRIEDRLAAEPSVKLVSFSVDPARDTPAALSAYARRFDALSDRWTFLTGDPQTLNRLDGDVFHLGHLSAAFDHSTRFVLVDSRSRIRAYYAMSLEDMVQRVAHDALSLYKETT